MVKGGLNRIGRHAVVIGISKLVQRRGFLGAWEDVGRVWQNVSRCLRFADDEFSEEHFLVGD